MNKSGFNQEDRQDDVKDLQKIKDCLFFVIQFIKKITV